MMETALKTDQLPSRVLIVGLGKTGLSCARYLSARGMQVAVTDSREQPPGLEALRRELPDVGLFLGGFDQALFDAADMLVLSPGVPLETPAVRHAVEKGVPVLGDVEIFAREVQAPVVAITGSNGKSTVTTLFGQMARAAGRRTAIGGNLGEPVLDLLDERNDLYVLELSSFQLETTDSLAPAVAVVLNISADHMDRYPSLDAYADTKAGLYDHAQAGVYNLDDARVAAMPRTSHARFFTLDAPAGEDTFGLCEEAGEIWLCRSSQRLLRATDLCMPGRHNLANALACLAMGSLMDLPLDVMLEVLTAFPGLAHRTEYVCEYRGVTWYNDSKGTNPGATVAALEGLDRGDDSRTVLIAGGDCKDADFSSLAAALDRYARGVVLMGRDRDQIRRHLDENLEVVEAADLDAAVQQAAALARAGDRILLSPACASFDMFAGFEDRGDQFKASVERYCQ
ncbi:UDP-N-acetylmuramoyl-L-alanine--D-glutamate ligase [Thiolapillus brandeum]|uniref:UDP-N-acetylmuramoylalanine--D-glutamate ligase n=1 Tax=Thiolapillus brandeum TaxID=1076588 RepID=A0A7U6GH23_9GAMM|nr:UDP-N-acetylmuramoyl-L-alanine--D-glutamate ligase [Thiolapillus brandeum]BAO43501.1 UDP-N-acetylmuramoylalanine--D-glutamate ligase [Thiolapillus brandeum]